MAALVLVESPTKARTLSKFLGEKYRVEATMGHIRDLPKASFGIDISRDFEPKYVIPKAKAKKVNELKKLAKSYSRFFLATDPDREGEAIAWHIRELLAASDQRLGKDKDKTNFQPLKADNRFKRVVFHEITPQAIKEAFAEPQELNIKLVHAQQARRILDRIVGYKLSPLLWAKIQRGLSAGRVQSVTLRLICEREREIEKFKPKEYWTIEARLRKISGGQAELLTLLIEKDGKKISIKNEKEAKEIVSDLQDKTFSVAKITKKEVRKYPFPPFTTSTLQQTAANRLGYTAKKTMRLAQELYEHGLITYMRTDSVNLADSAIYQAREYIKKTFGENFLPPQPKKYRVTSKVAQEAHEAIRPTDINLTSEKLPISDSDYRKLYDLIWRRTLACQMKEANHEQKTVDIQATRDKRQETSYLFRVTDSAILFSGWLALYPEEKDEEKALPDLVLGEALKLIDLMSKQHFTEPQARYTDASLIKALEHFGIGRPSTYAPIISTIIERNYVEKKDRKFYPTPLGIAVCDYLVKNFPDIVEISFTAQMEEELDEIARGEEEWVPVIKRFYGPFETQLSKVFEEGERVKVVQEETSEKCPKCGKPMVIRYGRFGKFLACSGFPECKTTMPIRVKLGLSCPLCGGDIIQKKTKKGKTFYGCSNYPACNFASWRKPNLSQTAQIQEDGQRTPN